MEPRIRYARTTDGVNIAFWTLGQGMPLVHMPVDYSNIQEEWRIEQCRVWYEGLARNRNLIRYDPRGAGMSDRHVTDYSLKARIWDLEAVLNRLELKRVALLAIAHSGPAAIAYAAERPERVSHLLLWCTFPRGSDNWESKRAQAIRSVRESDWEMYCSNEAEFGLGLTDPEQRRQFAEYIAKCKTPEEASAAMASVLQLDVRDLLPRVSAPTLVMHRAQIASPDTSVARYMASSIRGAELALFEGVSQVPYVGDTEAVLSAVDRFLGEQELTANRIRDTVENVLRTIMFTDVEGSTSLTERLGDVRAREVLGVHERIVREALKIHGGSEVKAMGDGFMASFLSASRAMECAIAIQTAVAAHNQSEEEPIEVRIGLNAGEPVMEQDDLFGTTVNMAARVAAHAKGGEILVPDVVRQLAAGKAFLFSDRGEIELRGFADTVHLYELRWRQPE